jgi:hypothetical protein
MASGLSAGLKILQGTSVAKTADSGPVVIAALKRCAT